MGVMRRFWAPRCRCATERNGLKMKKTASGRFPKLLSILCTAALVATSIPATLGFAASAEEAQTKTFDFENGIWTAENTSGFHTNPGESFTTENGTKLYYQGNPYHEDTQIADIVSETNDEGANKVLKIYNANEGEYFGAFDYALLALTDDNGSYKLENRNYTVSLRYKTTALGTKQKESFLQLAKGVRPHKNSNFRLQSLTAVNQTVDVANPTDTKNSGEKVTLSSVNEEWQTYETSFRGIDETALYDGTTLYPYLMLYFQLEPGAELLIDDIVVTAQPYETVSVTLNAGEGTFAEDGSEKAVDAKPGMDISEKIVSPEGKAFKGWYDNAELTGEPVTAYPEQNCTLYAAFSGASADVYDFEGDTALTSGTIGGMPLVSKENGVVSVVSDGDNKVLSIKKAVTNSWEVGVFLLNNGGSIATLVPGEEYTVSFRYKMAGIPASAAGTNGWVYMTQSPSVLNNDGTWGNLKSAYNAFGGAHGSDQSRIFNGINSTNTATVKDLNGNLVCSGKWNTFSYTFTAKAQGTSNYLGFAFCTVTGMEMYIDDVVIAKNYKVVEFDYNDGVTHGEYAYGGGAVELPASPSRAGFAFGGWYLDKGYNISADGLYFSQLAEYTKVYAKWTAVSVEGVYKFDFENGSTVTSGKIGNTPVSSFSDGRNIYSVVDDNGNSVLRIGACENMFETKDGKPNYRNGTLILNKDGAIPQLVAGKQYTVSARVKIKTLNTSAKARVSFVEDIIIGDTGNANEFGEVLGDSSAFTDKYTAKSRSDVNYELIKDINIGTVPVKDINDNTVPVGEWHTITKTFTAYPEMTNGNLFVGFTSCAGANQEFYVDDVIIADSSVSIISFNSNGGSKAETVYAENGTTVNLPTPEREGYVFGGWYTNAVFTEKAADPFVANCSVTLYARWRLAEAVTVDFETAYDGKTDVNGFSNFGGSYALNKEGAVNHGTAADYDANGVKSGSASLIAAAGTSSSSALLRSDGKPDGITAAPGARYKITVNYRLASGDVTGTALSVGTSAVTRDGWYKVDDYADGGVYLTNSADWTQTTLYYKNTTDTEQYLHLRIDGTNAADHAAKVFIDDIVAEELGDETVVVSMIGNGNMWQKHLFGKEGESLALESPVRAGCRFLRWHRDVGVKYDSDVFPSTDTVLYAKWSDKGDVNLDEKVDITDLIRLKKYLADPNTYTVSANPEADVTANGGINADDLGALRKILLGIK